MNAAAPARVYDTRYSGIVLGILAGMALMVTYVETMVLPAFSNFESFFRVTDASTIAWILSAYLLVGVVVTPIFGKLGDIYGKKRMLLIAMGVYTVAVSIAGFTPNIGAAIGLSRPNQIYVLIGVRALQGVGMAMFPLGFAMLPEVFPPAKVGQAQGILSGMFAGGAALGLVGGGWIAQNYGWQLTYHTVIPVAIIVFVLAALLIRESTVRAARKIDFPGVASLGFGLSFLMLGITEGAYWGWTNLTGGSVAGVTVGVPEFFVVALAAFAFFLWWEPRAPSPIVSFKELRARNIWVSNLNGVIVGMSMFLMFTILVILGEYPSPGFGLGEFNAALMLVPAVIGMMVFGPFLGRMISRFGPKPVMLLGFVLITIGSLGLLAFNRTNYEVAVAAIPIMVGNVGVLISMSNIIVLSVDPRTMGVHTGMNQTFRNLGSALGPVLVTSILASYIIPLTVPNGSPPPAFITFDNYQLHGYEAVFALTAAIGFVGLLVSLALRNYRFRADGTRLGEASGAAPAPPRPETPAPAPVSAAGPGTD
ncbi:MAG: MFS transporter [Thermoplasmata archaeon]|jgi:MFS family permease|nr:MFS transporter [Thermoplasmata archaeon]